MPAPISPETPRSGRCRLAYDFYFRAILEPLIIKQSVARQYNFPNDEVASRDWEIFCALLLDRASPGKTSGADLREVEVKSSKDRGSFEYQYHRNHGLAKLLEDAHIHQIFVSYLNDYRDITVRFLRSEQVHDVIRAWRPSYIEKYASSKTGGRCRMNLSHGFVASKGVEIMRIVDGKLEEAHDEVLADLLRPASKCEEEGCVADEELTGISSLKAKDGSENPVALTSYPTPASLEPK